MNYLERYKELKKSLTGLSYRGYPLDRVCGSYLAAIVWQPNIARWFKFILFKASQIPFIKGDEKLILTYSIEREDYKQLMSAYFPEIEPSCVGFKNSLVQLLVSICSTPKFFLRAKAMIRERELSLKDYLTLLVVTNIAVKIIDELESRDEVKTNAYVAFNSSFLLESFFTYYFKKRNIPTYSLQHGMYCKYTNQATPYDVINYENICADTLLTWGTFTVEQINELVPNDVTLKVIGNPLIQVNSTTLDSRTEIYVLLPRDIYWKESFELLSLLKKLDTYSFIVRPHPSVKNKVEHYCNNQSNFEVDTNTNSNTLIASYYFKAVISFNSTSVFTALAHQQNFFYYDNRSEIDVDTFSAFSTYDELLTLFEKQPKKRSANYFYAQISNLTETLFK